jgi:hypothetical protein
MSDDEFTSALERITRRHGILTIGALVVMTVIDGGIVLVVAPRYGRDIAFIGIACALLVLLFVVQLVGLWAQEQMQRLHARSIAEMQARLVRSRDATGGSGG